jgi:hypothetical protein
LFIVQSSGTFDFRNNAGIEALGGVKIDGDFFVMGDATELKLTGCNLTMLGGQFTVDDLSGAVNESTAKIDGNGSADFSGGSVWLGDNSIRLGVLDVYVPCTFEGSVKLGVMFDVTNQSWGVLQTHAKLTINAANATLTTHTFDFFGHTVPLHQSFDFITSTQAIVLTNDFGTKTLPFNDGTGGSFTAGIDPNNNQRYDLFS